MYKLITHNNETVMIHNITTGFFIPLVADNTDYQEYLKWLEEGNTPEPADELNNP